jgi:hypothetical protein
MKAGIVLGMMDHAGQFAGMPSVVSDFEHEVEAVARPR